MGTFMQEVKKEVAARIRERRRRFLNGCTIRAPRPKTWRSRPRKYEVGVVGLKLPPTEGVGVHIDKQPVKE